MTAEIRVPRENVNDDTVRLVRWLVADGAELRPGMPVVELETSKSVVEVEATAAGRLRIHVQAGVQVPVGDVLGVIGGDESRASGSGTAAEASAPRAANVIPPSAASPGQSGTSTVSAKARRLMEEHGIDAAVFAHLPLVRESDVQAHLAASKTPAPPVVARHSAEHAVDHTADTAWQPKGLLGDAARASSDRGVSVWWLAFNYLWRNWFLGNLVKVAPRGVINVLHRWRGVRMGADCFVDPAAILETAYPENITIGNDVRVTAGAIIMTHIKPPHYLRDKGYVPVVLKPVVLEDHCFIGVNAVVMPGVTVGRASVVGSGAVVTADVPPLTMVAGNPARIIKRFGE
jgi:acetyltransferase-like isoleucine patch superfamily enzyme